MKLATFRAAGAPTLGVIENDEALDVGAEMGSRFPDLKSVIAADS